MLLANILHTLFPKNSSLRKIFKELHSRTAQNGCRSSYTVSFIVYVNQNWNVLKEMFAQLPSCYFTHYKQITFTKRCILPSTISGKYTTLNCARLALNFERWLLSYCWLVPQGRYWCGLEFHSVHTKFHDNLYTASELERDGRNTNTSW